MDTPMADITWLLDNWRNGDRDALNHVVELVYDELRTIAEGHLKRSQNHSDLLSVTVLINEAYLKLSNYPSPAQRPWRNRGQFYALASTVMLHVLADYGRRKRAQRRGGRLIRVTLKDQAADLQELDMVELLDILEKLRDLDARSAMIWQCRYIAGLSISELCETFQLASATVHKELKSANGWIHYQLMGGGARSGN